MKYWIKERRNPQLGTYYVALGRMYASAARQYERSIYGTNFVHSFQTQKAYNARLEELRAAGERVQ